MWTINLSIIGDNWTEETGDHPLESLEAIPQRVGELLTVHSINPSEPNAIAIYVSRNGTNGFASHESDITK